MGVPQHVLRFWETKFSQIDPMKRGGGRRYYRPEDIDIIEAVRKLLHEDGFTIKGAQKYLKEHGVKNVLDILHEEQSGKDRTTPKAENAYEAQILTITKKTARHQAEEADTVTALKKLKTRLETIRQHLRVD